MNVKKVTARYADETTPYSCVSDNQTLTFELKFISNKPFHWVHYNHVNVNPGKCPLLLSFKTATDVSIDNASQLAQKKPYLESLLTQNIVLINMFLPFVVKLATSYMLWDALLALHLLKKAEH